MKEKKKIQSLESYLEEVHQGRKASLARDIAVTTQNINRYLEGRHVLVDGVLYKIDKAQTKAQRKKEQAEKSEN